jgi:chemotaxis protein methyltransferase CheR
MKHILPDGLLSQLSGFIAAKTALHFPPDRWDDLERKAGSAAKEFGFAGTEDFIQWVLSSPLTPGQLDMLASHLTIHETYFWREPQVFEALVTQILPELKPAPWPWSAVLRALTTRSLRRLPRNSFKR